MKKLTITLTLLIISSLNLFAQEDTKVALITLDGFRWQELFTGADPLLVANNEYVHDTTDLKTRFWSKNAEERRKTLLPFIWNEVSQMGEIHGNRTLGSKVNLTNSMWFSYPGYHEILSGFADDERITSNAKMNNPNATILELANNDSRYKGKVAAFASWDVFPFIINEERSGVPVNAGFDIAKGDKLTDKEVFLNKMQPKVPSPWGTVRLDAFTHYYALEFMQKEHPHLVYVAYGETDDFAHDGEYDAYLKSAQQTDSMIKELWDFTQNDPFYKDQTLFIITTDHGRGTDPLKSWKDHGSKVKNAGEVWMILFGKGVSGKGEVAQKEQLHTTQIAPTILETLKISYNKENIQGIPLKSNN